MPTSNPQWSAGAQAAPTHTPHSPRERTHLPGHEHGSPSDSRTHFGSLVPLFGFNNNNNNIYYSNGLLTCYSILQFSKHFLISSAFNSLISSRVD